MPILVLHATSELNNTVYRSIEVYDLDGHAYIIKQMPNGSWLDWHSYQLTAEQWVEMNNQRPRKTPWQFVESAA